MIEQLTNRTYGWSVVSLAVLVSLIYIALTYSPGFVFGTGTYWDVQTNDVGTYITGLRFYLRDEWRFPLFFVKTMNYPDGSNIAFTDSLPLLALPAKILYKLTGVEWNYFGHWFILSNLLFAFSIALLLHSLGIRSRILYMIAMCFGFSVFPYVYRTFHIALSSHFLIIMALSFYFYGQHQWSPRKGFVLFLILTIISLLVHFYLFVFAVLLAGACFLDLYVQKKITFRRLLLYGVYALAAIVAVMLSVGYLSLNRNRAYGTFGSAGLYSMNVLSPVTPVYSFFFKHAFYKDPTGKQFAEGMNYLGIAVIVLCFIVLIKYPRVIQKAVLSYRWLALLCVGLFGFSLSSEMYCAERLILKIPLIPGVETLYRTLQSTGRFFWIDVYLLTLMPIVLLWKRVKSKKALLTVFVILAVMQNIEIWGLRQSIRQKTTAHSPVDTYSFCDELVRQHRLILVSRPQADQLGSYTILVRTVYFLAGKHNVLMNYAYTARSPRASTALETLLDNEANTSTPVLLILPKDHQCPPEKLRDFPYVLNKEGFQFFSNHVDISKY